MGDFERFSLFFRGGTAKKQMTGYDFSLLFADLFDLHLFKRLRIISSSPSIDRSYTTNEEFWQESLRKQHFQSMRVHLQGFHLLEWMPSAPGRYFTGMAQGWRHEAQRNHFRSGEYTPHGKASMIRGGIGSVRLGVKRIETMSVYLLGASSTGISHQGIPIAVFEPEYHKVIQVINKHGGCLVNLVGNLQLLSSSKIPLQYDREIPKYCLISDSIEIIRPSLSSELLATVAITFPHDVYSSTFKKAWSFCSFCPESVDKPLERAVDWLKHYARVYSGIDNPPIISDFDEHYRHFDNPVEFPLSHLFSDNIDIDRFEEYQTYYNFRPNTTELNEQDVVGKTNYKKSHQLSWPHAFKPVNICFSYAHEDEVLLNELKKQLKPLQRQGFISMWHDRDIKAGTEWEREINEYLNTAHIILLLISPDFINSDYCYCIEMQHAMERHECGEAVVIPIILRPVNWDGTPFSKLQVLPTSAKSVTDSSWYNLDSACFNVAEGVRRVVEHLAIKSLTSPSQTTVKTLNTELPFPIPVIKPEEFILLRTFAENPTLVEKIVITSDGRTLVGSSSLRSNVWDLATGELHHSISTNSMSTIAVSPDGQTLIIGCWNSSDEMKLWDLYTRKLLYTLTIPTRDIVIHANGQEFVIASRNQIEVRSLHTGQLFRTLQGHTYDVTSLAISPDGNRLISGDKFGTIKAWNLHTGEQLGTIVDQHLGNVLSLIIGPDGQIVTSMSESGTITRWNLYTQQLLNTFKAHEEVGVGIAISPDGQLLASAGGRNKVAKLWNICTGQLLHTFPTRIKRIRSIAFGPEGQIFIGGGYDDTDGKIEVWGKTQMDTIEPAPNRNTR